jgi:hypothetical protein
MRRSPHQFTGIGSLSPTLWLARGYAVLDGPGFPIVAEGDEEPNDTYVEQLTASAEAAVKVRRNLALSGLLKRVVEMPLSTMHSWAWFKAHCKTPVGEVVWRWLAGWPLPGVL